MSSSGARMSLVLYVDARDSPRDAYEAAKLAVAYRNKGNVICCVWCACVCACVCVYHMAVSVKTLAPFE